MLGIYGVMRHSWIQGSQLVILTLANNRIHKETAGIALHIRIGQFGSAYIPLTVVVNADGTSGFEFDGVLGAEALERVLAVFVRTDGPLAMETVPQEAE